MIEPLFHYQFRLIVIGDSTVGKSTLLKHFTEGQFAEVCDPTVGVDFYARLIELRPGLRIKLQLWDTAGQEKFRSITRSYYRNSVGVLLIYDVSRRETFEHIPTWLDEATRNVGSSQCVFILVGHKADLSADREVLHEEGEYFAKHHKMKFLETSARTGENVEEAFNLISREIYARLETGEFCVAEDWEGIKTSGYQQRRHSAISLTDTMEEETSPCWQGSC